jgi:hypothetical protein
MYTSTALPLVSLISKLFDLLYGQKSKPEVYLIMLLFVICNICRKVCASDQKRMEENR